MNPFIRIHDKKNSGHGSTILLGYKENCIVADWVFQVDSDNEISAGDFYKLWQKRGDFDVLIGVRKGRQQTSVRKIISAISRITVRVFYGGGVYDTNSPYRLMRSRSFKDFFLIMPDNTLTPKTS